MVSESYCSRHEGSGCDRWVCVLASLCEEKWSTRGRLAPQTCPRFQIIYSPSWGLASGALPGGGLWRELLPHVVESSRPQPHGPTAAPFHSPTRLGAAADPWGSRSRLETGPQP